MNVLSYLSSIGNRINLIREASVPEWNHHKALTAGEPEDGEADIDTHAGGQQQVRGGHPHRDRPAGGFGRGRGAGFIGVDEIRMLLEKIFTLIWHFNFYTYIILVFKFIKGILFFLDLDGETRGKNNAL